MRKWIPHLLLLMMAGTLLQVAWITIPRAQTSPSSALDVLINRTLWVNEWGVTSLNDTITIVNKGDEGVSHIAIGVPSRFHKQLKYFEASEYPGRYITVDKEEGEGYVWMKYNFPEMLYEGDSYTFTSLTVFSGAISYHQQVYSVNFFATPILSIRIEYYNLTVSLPADATITLPENSPFEQIRYTGLPSLHREYRELAPYTEEPLQFIFGSVTTQLLDFHWSKRVLTMEPEGRLRIADSYKISNPAIVVSSISINLPEGAEEIMAYDRGGEIWEEPQTGDQVTVTPRYGMLKTNESFQFTLKYTVPKGEYLRQTRWWGVYELNSSLLTPQPWIIEGLEVEVILPRGAQVDTINQLPHTTSTDFYTKTLYYSLTAVTPYTPLSLEARITYPFPWMAFKPLIWIVIVAAVITVFAVTRPRERVIEETIIKPSHTLKQFSEIQDEKMAIRMELDKAEENRSRRAISKKEYRRRRRGLEARILKLNRTLKPLKIEMKKSHQRYEELITRLERGEARIEAVRASLTSIRAQYRAGRVDKNTFQKMEADLSKDMKKAKEDVDSIIVTLREEAE